MKQKGIVVLIPTLNEAKAIIKTLDDVLEYLPECQIVVLDSYSSNGTVDLVKSKPVAIINAPKGGKGLAVRSVLARVMSTFTGKCYVMLNGDYTYPARHILEFAELIENGADVVIGYRNLRAKGAMSRMNAIGNWGLSMLASMLYRVRVKDVCSGMWGFHRDVLFRYKLSSKGFTLEADLFVNTVKGKYKLTQIPIEYRARLDGSVAKLGVGDGFKIAWFLIKSRFGR